jgi:Lrp/AsnC family leucine-responsive transcriptional regulator
MKLELSDNEKEVLKCLLQEGRMSCTEIGRQLGITSQAVGKIQDKLEETGVIRGYRALVDYEKLGIDVIAIAFFRFKSGAWTRLEKEDIMSRVKGPHLVRAYRLNESEFTHIVVYGFRSIKELDNYFHILQTEREHISELKKLYVLSASSVLKDSPVELMTKILDEYGQDILARPEPPQPMD